MKKTLTKTLSKFVLGALPFVCSLSLAQASFAAAPKKADYTFELQSSVKGLGVLQDGIMGSGVNLEMEGKKGLNEITVSAPEYATRKIRFWLEPGKKKTIPIELSKIKYQTTPNWKSPFKRFDGSKLEKRASACATIVVKTQDKSNCDRLSYLDDIFYAEHSIFNIDDLRVYQKDQDLDTFRQLLGHIDQSASASGIEDFFTRHPSQPSAFHLASLFNLLQGDCPRVHSIFTEAQQVLEQLGTLRLHMAVCAEANSNLKLRDQVVADGLKGKTPDLGLSYWLFQNQILTSLPKATATALACFKSSPGDLRCQDQMAMVAKVQDKPYRMNGANIEDVTFKNFMATEANLLNDQQEALFLVIAAQLQDFPLSIENYVLLSWINTVYSKDLTRDYYTNKKIQVAAVQAGPTLDKIVEAIEQNNMTQLLPPIYMRRLRFEPEDPNLWYRLIRSFAKAKQCKDMLNAMTQGAEFLPKYNASLLQMKGSCEVDLQRFKDALSTYSKIMELNPKTWSSPYNLANVYDRLGQKKEAYIHYQKALDLKPPADMLDAVKMKVLQFQPSNAKKPQPE